MLLGPIIYLLVAGSGAELVKTTVDSHGHVTVAQHDPEPWLIVAIVGGLLALAGWALNQRRRAALAGAEEDEARARKAAEQAKQQLRESEQQRDRLAHERDHERAEQQRRIEAWFEEREWNRRLRKRIAELQNTRGLLGRHDDVREMVLELTMQLTDAEKGMLISQHERTSDRKFQVVCALGFEHDAQESGLAQRFASEVIERDTTIREDSGQVVDENKRTPADEEVRNLLAIPLYIADEFEGVILCANREGGFESLEDEVLLAIGDHAGAVLQNARLHGDLRSAYLSTIRVLASAIELKDPELRGHSDAVSEYVLAVSDRLDFEPRRREELIFASLLHDIGKLGISERILLKPAALTAEERAVVELHPRIGHQLVRQIPALEPIASAVLHHHERFDGNGYPARLRGEAIPIESRIIAVADTFSAMTSERPYSPARTPEEACKELERCAGEQFDPEVVRLFVEEVRRHPPDDLATRPLPADPELDAHRDDGDFVLGARSFAITDSLTLLYSHRHFHETAHAEAERSAVQGRPFAIVVGRLTDLHEINRARGFAAGDAALQSVGAVFQRVAATHMGSAFRSSGRTIAMLAPELHQTQADKIVDSLLRQLDSELNVGLGAAAWQPGESGEQVIERALQAARGAAPVVA
jgi:diguanylate cyclase (GGDEF)-like protein